MEVAGGEATAALRHSLAYLVRRRDATVEFKARPLLEETVFNLGGIITLPLLLWRHGITGARNRSFWPCDRTPIPYVQLFFNLVTYAFIGLCWVYVDRDGFQLTHYEITITLIFNALRALTIGVKYATYTEAELRELDYRLQSEQEKQEKLILRGWTQHMENTISTELEKSITRQCPHFGRHAILFPDVATRDAVLHQLAGSLRSFLYQEYGVGAAPPRPPMTCPIDAAASVSYYLEVTAQMEQEQALEGVPDRAAQQLAAAKNLRCIGTDAALGTGFGTHAGKPVEPAVVPGLKAHVPVPPLPSIPAKLFAWHILSTAAAQVNTRLPYLFPNVVPLVAALLPMLVRVGMQYTVGGSHYLSFSLQGAVAMGLMMLQLCWYLYAALTFVAVAVIDHLRRLAATEQLLQLLDTNALLALRMHDAVADCEAAEEMLPLTELHGPVRAAAPASPAVNVRNPIAVAGAGVVTAPPATAMVVTDAHTRRHSTEASLPALRASHSRYRPGFEHMDIHPEDEDTPYLAVVAEHAVVPDGCGAPGPSSRHSQPPHRRSSSLVYPEPGWETADRVLTVDQGSFTLRAGTAEDARRADRLPVRAKSHAQPEGRGVSASPVVVPAFTAPAVPSLAVAAPRSQAPRKHHITPVAEDEEVASASITPDGGVAALHTSVSLPSRGADGEGLPLMRRGKSSVGLRVRTAMVKRHALLPQEQVQRQMLQPSAQHISLPLLYPQNLIAWAHIRSVTLDHGRSFYQRILLFTSFFGLFVVGAVIYLIASVALSWDKQDPLNTYLSLSLTVLSQASFGGLLALQTVLGARINFGSVRMQGQLFAIQSLAYEVLATARNALPSVVRDRLLTVKKVASTVSDGLRVMQELQPARVVFLTANYRLLGTMASVVLSGVIAAVQGLRTMDFGAPHQP